MTYNEFVGPYICHHGIKGQKWGVRRFQNPDGTLTAAGRERQYYRRRTKEALGYADDVNKIVSSLSKKEQRMLGMRKNDKKWIEDDTRVEQSSNIVKTFLEKHGDTPVSMLEIWDEGNGVGAIAIATDPNYRGTGATSKNIQNALKWFDSAKNTKIKDLRWDSLKENSKSGQIAEKHGFGELETDDNWEHRVRRKK